MIRIALFSVVLVTVSACGGSAAVPPSGFINEPSTTVVVATTAASTTTTKAPSTTVEAAPTTLEPDDSTSSELGFDLRPDWVDESLLVLSQPGTVEAEIETAVVRYDVAAREALLAGDVNYPPLLAATPGPPQDAVRREVQRLVADYVERGEVILRADTHPTEDREGVAKMILEDIDTSSIEQGVGRVTWCAVIADFVVDSEGSIVDDELLSERYFAVFNRSADGWRVTSTSVLGSWNGATECA